MVRANASIASRFLQITQVPGKSWRTKLEHTHTRNKDSGSLIINGCFINMQNCVNWLIESLSCQACLMTLISADI